MPTTATETLAVQNYVKAIYQVGLGSDDGTASTGKLARYLELTPGTVTSMLRRLAEMNLVDYRAHRGARLTEQGREAALRVVRRHRLIELFLAHTLGLPWDEVHQEAENLEHAVSDRLIDRIDEVLDFPDRDPHGDPIPNRDGALRSSEGQSLARCTAGTRFVLIRVPDHSAEFLRYLADNGLTVGATATVVENRAEAGVITVENDGRRLSLGRDVAEGVLVRRA